MRVRGCNRGLSALIGGRQQWEGTSCGWLALPWHLVHLSPRERWLLAYAGYPNISPRERWLLAYAGYPNISPRERWLLAYAGYPNSTRSDGM